MLNYGRSLSLSCLFTRAVKIFFGLAEGKWKKRYCNHKMAFNDKRYSHETALSSYMWHLKENLDVTPNLKWSIVRCATLYSNISKKCLLCLYEKQVTITCSRQFELLNKRSELFCKCRHENKYLLKNARVKSTLSGLRQFLLYLLL